MDLKLKDKAALAEWAGKSLGRACAEVLAQKGAKFTIPGRTQSVDTSRSTTWKAS